jgi:hypothetical protein
MRFAKTGWPRIRCARRRKSLAARIPQSAFPILSIPRKSRPAILNSKRNCATIFPGATTANRKTAWQRRSVWTRRRFGFWNWRWEQIAACRHATRRRGTQERVTETKVRLGGMEKTPLADSPAAESKMFWIPPSRCR